VERDKGLALAMGPGLVNFLWLRSGRVSHLWFGFRKFPLKCQIFQFLPLWVKKISLGWLSILVKVTAGQKYAQVGSGQWPSLVLRVS